MGRILKLDNHDEDSEIAFEIDYLLSLSIKQRFEMMFQKTNEIRSLMKNHGYRKNIQIIKRK